MNKNVHFRHLLELNLAMILVSTSGALGRYITMPPPVTVWWRCILAAIFLGIFCWRAKINLKFNLKKDGLIVFISGVLMFGHWITYFYALQLSNVALGMLSLFTYPVMTAFLEPLILKTKFQMVHLGLALLVLLGIYFLTPQLDLNNQYTQGIALGLLSALFYSFRNLLIKKKVTLYSGSTLMFYQMVAATFVLAPALLFFDTSGIINQWPATLTLALVTTAIGHTLFLMCFKHFSISTASLISSAQPVYGIIIGMIFLHEIPVWTTVIGGVLILATVIIESLRSYR